MHWPPTIGPPVMKPLEQPMPTIQAQHSIASPMTQSLGQPLMMQPPGNSPMPCQLSSTMTQPATQPPMPAQPTMTQPPTQPSMPAQPTIAPPPAQPPTLAQPTMAQPMVQPLGPPPTGQPMAHPPMHASMAPPGMQSQRQRVDPNMLPSAVQVMDDDRRASAGDFHTGFPQAEQPPMVTATETNEIDSGNCLPRFMRSTLYCVPNTEELLKNSELPFAVHISPLASIGKKSALPLVDLGSLEPVRCMRCRAYMCPFMQLTDGGRRFTCVFCTASSPVPEEYFAHLDHQGIRTDISYRPELCCGSYEYVATTQYCKNGMLPKPPAFIFMLDVSYNSVRSGVVSTFCQHALELLRNLPREELIDGTMETARVAFVCYDSEMHFYSLNAPHAQLTRLTVSELQEAFAPEVDTLFVRVDEAASAIETLLADIPRTYSDTAITESMLGPVIEAGLDALVASDRAGKLIVMHSSLPNNERAPGKLKNRDDKKLLGTDKAILPEQGKYYSELAEKCVAGGCSVDLYLFPNAFIDIATIGLVPLITGGQTWKYQYFDVGRDAQRFIADLAHNLHRPTAFDAMMRLRTSTGIRPVNFYGGVYMQNTIDVELASVDSDKCVTIEIKYDDKLYDQPAVLQAALLYTSISGQRRLRIHNLSLANGGNYGQMYRHADMDAVALTMFKQAERLVREKTTRDVRDFITSRCAQILAVYREKCSDNAPAGQLILPEGLKLLPLYANCILKHDAIAGGADISLDDRAWLMHMVPQMCVRDSVFTLYTRCIDVLAVSKAILDDDFSDMPMLTRASYEFLSPESVYIMENGMVLFVWIGVHVSDEWAKAVFGVRTVAHIDTERCVIPWKDTKESNILRKLIDYVQKGRSRHMKIVLIRQGDKLEPWCRKYLVEDKTPVSNGLSYVDYLCHIHREIRAILS